MMLLITYYTHKYKYMKMYVYVYDYVCVGIIFNNKTIKQIIG